MAVKQQQVSQRGLLEQMYGRIENVAEMFSAQGAVLARLDERVQSMQRTLDLHQKKSRKTTSRAMSRCCVKKWNILK